MFTTIEAPTKAGLLNRLWTKKQTENVLVPTVSVPEARMPVNTRNCEKLSENVPNASGPKLMPGIGSLRIALMGGSRTVGELATALKLTSVQASRLISRAQAEGHVRKTKVGRHVYVTAVPLEELRK